MKTIILSAFTLLYAASSVLGDHHKKSIDEATIASYKVSFEAKGGKVLTPADDEYGDYTTPWNLLCTERPYVVFIPSTYEDITDALNLIRDNDEDFNVMSGGHNWDCEALTTGALINTALFNRLDIDLSQEMVTLGAGVLWDDVYHELKDTGYMAIGPLCPSVGVSGFTLGGGFNWFLSTFYGTAAENTVSIDVLLATGEIVTATHDNEYADLAWGLLGSGRGQMGIVLEYHMRLHVDPGYTHLYIPYTFTDDESEINPTNGIYSLDNYMEIYKSWVHAVDMLKDDEDIGSIAMNTNRDFSKGTGSRHYDFFVAGVFNQVKDWNEMESMMEVVEAYPPAGFYQTHYDQWYDLDYTVFAPAWLKYPITTWAGPSAFLTDFNDDVIEAHGRFMVPLTQEDADTYSTGTHLESFLVKGAVKNTTLTSVGNANVEWKLARFFLESPIEASDDIFLNINDWNKNIEKAAGKDYLGGYINYGDSTLKKKYYYGENLKRLQQIKNTYDEENVFNTKQGVSKGKGDKSGKGSKSGKGGKSKVK